MESLLKEIKINYEKDLPVLVKNNKFYKKNVVFTGKFSSISREEAKRKAESMGAIVSSSLSSKTDFLIYGNDPGGKLKEAEKLGIPLIKDSEWQLEAQEDL
jgi:DNA ligase (NAD+)